MAFKWVPLWRYHWVNSIISGRSPPLYCTLTLIAMKGHHKKLYRTSTIPRNIRGCQSGTWSQRGTKVDGSHHGDNPPDGEVRGSRSSLVRMRDMDPPEVPLRQAPYNTPQDIASNSRSLVQVAEQALPLVHRCPSPNPMREHRNNRTHEEVVVGGGATPHG